MSPCQVSYFRDKILLEQKQGQYEKMLMKSENMRKYQDFSASPRSAICKKKNKIKY
jgi:hypothetical protein